MTKNKLNWRLTDLPTASEVADLVDSEVITKEEARQILFNDTQEDSRALKAKDEEIAFLRKLVDDLARKNNGWNTIVHEYRDYRPKYPYWYNTYGTVMKTLETTPFVGYSSTAGSMALAPGKASNGTVTMSVNSGSSSKTTFVTANQDIKGLSSIK